MTEDAGAGWLVNAALSSCLYQYCHLGVWPLHSQNQYRSGMREAHVDTVAMCSISIKRDQGDNSHLRPLSILFFPFLFVVVSESEKIEKNKARSLSTLRFGLMPTTTILETECVFFYEGKNIDSILIVCIVIIHFHTLNTK